MTPPITQNKLENDLGEPVFTLAQFNSGARKCIAARREDLLDNLLKKYRFSDDGAFVIDHNGNDTRKD